MPVPSKIDGAKPKKVYMHYEEGAEDNHLTLKMTLPSKWAGHNVDYLRDFFVEHYNGKKADNQLTPAEYHLEKKGNRTLFGDELLYTAVEKYDDLFLKQGESPQQPTEEDASKPEVEEAGLVRCRNHGCQQKFREEENHDEACHHHAQPPLFHDMKKGWQCCPNKMVYDWDEFEQIPTCTVGRHSAEEPTTLFAKSPTVLAAEEAKNDPEQPAPTLKSIDTYNAANPDAVTAVSSASTAKPKAKRTDGKAQCINFGCQQEYVVAENTDTSCVHHTGPPVFHDAGKYWTCCPNKVKYDFEEFLQIPGCSTSAHTDAKE